MSAELNEREPLLTRRTNALQSTDVERQAEMPPTTLQKITKLEDWYIAYYFPALGWISRYKAEYLLGDVCAGFTMASFLLPTCLSYATSLAHVKAVTACFGLIVPPLIYALFGSVPQMVIGPESAISLVVGHAVDLYSHNTQADGTHHLPNDRSDISGEQVVALLSGIVGAMILVMGLFRVGYIESVMSRSLLRGFITGVGLVMIVSQLGNQLGFEQFIHSHVRGSASAFERLVFICENVKQIHKPSALLTACAVSFLLISRIAKNYISKNINQKAALFPDTMVVVILSTIACWYFKLDEKGVVILGDIKPGKLKLQWMLKPLYWHDFRANFVTSFFISILGFLETTVAARSLGNLDTASSANRELVALGFSNLCGMVFGALPAFGGYGRSKLNRLSGAHTQLAAIISSLLTLGITYSLLHYLYYLPQPILATIISMIGVSLLQEAPAELRYFWSVGGYEDIATLLACFAGSFFWSVEAGVGLGTAIVVLRVVKHATRPRIQILARHPDSFEFVNADDFPREPHLHTCENPLESGVLVIKIPEPLTFANVGELGGRLRRLEFHGTANVHPGRPRTTQSQLHKVVFLLSGMTDCDPTAVAELHRIFKEYIDRGIAVVLCELSSKPAVQRIFEEAGLFNLVESQENISQTIFPTLASVFEE